MSDLLSGAIVAARLAEMARLSREYRDSAEGRAVLRQAARDVARGQQIDMSPTAIASRIQEMGALQRLCDSLGGRQRSA